MNSDKLGKRNAEKKIIKVNSIDDLNNPNSRMDQYLDKKFNSS